MPSFAVRNFGCRANQAEAFAWAGELRERGLRLRDDWRRTDIVVVNSCALTGRAERDVRKFIRAVNRTNPRGRIVVTGCYAERAPGEVAGLPGVVAVLPQSAKDGLAGRMLAIGGATGPAGGDMDPVRVPGTASASGGDMFSVRVPAVGEEAVEPPFRARAFLKIQDGCDHRCAYCIIPSLRGRSRSVGPEALAASVRDLAGRGFREIVLAGIHISSYGDDLEPRGSLPGLLDTLAVAARPARLRLSSLDPRRTDAALAARIAGDARICPHFHLSLQHASGRVLASMGRPSDPGSTESLMEELSRLAPDAALGADVMVGFPGETESDFAELKELVDRSPLTYAHVFSYSPRPGTPAAARPRPAPAVITERAKALRRAAAMKDYRFRRRFIGRELEAVVISSTAAGAEVLTGNSIRVLAPSSPAPEGESVRVAVRRVLPRRTEGEIVA